MNYEHLVLAVWCAGDGLWSGKDIEKAFVKSCLDKSATSVGWFLSTAFWSRARCREDLVPQNQKVVEFDHFEIGYIRRIQEADFRQAATIATAFQPSALHRATSRH